MRVNDSDQHDSDQRDMTKEQRLLMDAFKKEQSDFLKHGDLNDGQFDRISELGYGSGGVVLKVRHKPTGIIMARKVSENKRVPIV